MTRWLLLALLLTGCASKSVLYRHPETGALSACARSATPSGSGLGAALAPIPLLSLVGDAIDGAVWAVDATKAGNRYADCKTDLEQRGFVRDDP